MGTFTLFTPVKSFGILWRDFDKRRKVLTSPEGFL